MIWRISFGKTHEETFPFDNNGWIIMSDSLTICVLNVEKNNKTQRSGKLESFSSFQYILRHFEAA